MTSDLREGDSGVGIPDPGKADARPLTDAENEHYQRKDQEELEKRLRDILEESRPRTLGITVPKRLRSWVATGILLLSAVLILLLAAQAASLWGDLARLPFWGQVLIGGAAALSGLVLLLVVGRLLAFYLRVKTNDQIPLKVLKELAERGQLQKLGTTKAEEARQRLCAYLKEYPAEDSDLLKRMGLNHEEMSSLRDSRRTLLEKRELSATQWLDTFQNTFQKTLGQVAARTIRVYALKAGAGTAIAPSGLLDAAIVLNLSLLMVGDLVRLYRLRATKGESVVILGKAIGIAYLAGQIEAGAETIAEYLAEHGLEEGVSSLTRIVAGFLSAKVGEGVANTVLVHRLGAGVIKLLRPMAE